ncbi:MAG: HD domain-containing protein [Clostridia bacterium]|nr:HD domain-containing protein [Clostridia bacterium]
MTDDLLSTIEFIKTVDDMKRILRRNVNLDCVTRENDAEHSWHIALMAMILKDYAKDESTDFSKAVEICIAHDLVEIYAGDTFCWDKKGNETKAEREKNAADKLFSSLPGGQGGYIRGLWEEFEEKKTKESLYANAMDRLQPLILNANTEGHTWKMAGTTISQAMERFGMIKDELPEVWEYVEKVLNEAMEKGWILKD